MASGLQILFWASVSSGDDNSTCHTGVVKVINIHISCSRKGFFLDRLLGHAGTGRSVEENKEGLCLSVKQGNF